MQNTFKKSPLANGASQSFPKKQARKYNSLKGGFLTKKEIPFYESVLGYRGRQSSLSPTQGALPRPHLNDRHLPAKPKPSDHIKLLFGHDSADLIFGLRRISEGSKKSIFPAPFNKRKAIKSSAKFSINWIDELYGEDDVYLTQSSFVWEDERSGAKQARANLLDSTRVIFIDLDIYNAKIPLSCEEATRKLINKCKIIDCPEPLIINSGRGIYAIWVLPEIINLDRTNRIRWKSIQLRLQKWLSELGPDPKVCDLTRVLRLIGTRNSKSGTTVSVLHDTGQTASFGQLEKAMVRAGIRTPEIVQVNLVKEKAHRKDHIYVTETNESGQWFGCDEESLSKLKKLLTHDKKRAPRSGVLKKEFFLRYVDIMNLIISRSGIHEGLRSETVLWASAMRFLSGLMSANDLRFFAKDLALVSFGKLDCYDQGYLSTLERKMYAHEQMLKAGSVVKANRRGSGSIKIGFGDKYISSPVYTPSIDSLVKRLQIKPSEYDSMVRLVPGKVRRHRSYKKSSYAKEASRRKALFDKQKQQAVTHVLRGMAISDGASQFNISESALRQALLENQTYSYTRKKRTERFLSTKLRAIEQSLIIKSVFTDISIRTLAKFTGVAKSSLHNWLKSKNIFNHKEDMEKPPSFFIKRVFDKFQQTLLKPMSAPIFNFNCTSNDSSFEHSVQSLIYLVCSIKGEWGDIKETSKINRNKLKDRYLLTGSINTYFSNPHKDQLSVTDFVKAKQRLPCFIKEYGAFV